MAKRYVLELADAQMKALENMRDHHPKAYMRTRATAILKVAAGKSIRQVALHGLPRPCEPETVKAWLDRYLTEGLTGLKIRPGRGRKPAFSHPDEGDRGKRS